MAKKIDTSVTVKRSYSVDVREKLKRGEDWGLKFKVDADNADNILNEADKSETGFNYTIFMNHVTRTYFKNKKRTRSKK